MAEQMFTQNSQRSHGISFAGGLNTNASPFALRDDELSLAQNVYIGKQGRLEKRLGYVNLTADHIAGEKHIDGLWAYEYDSSGTRTQKLIAISNSKVYKMDGLDGTWDDITNSISITAEKRFSFAQFNNKLFFTNNTDSVFVVTNALAPAAATMPAGMTAAKFVCEFQNYVFYLNCLVSGTRRYSRLYYSAYNDDTTFSTLNFIDIANDDGQEITGARVLADRLVVYKNRSIYNVFFTGDRAVPFIVKKSNSEVGCASHWSICDVMGGHMFLSQDGVYFYDGDTSSIFSGNIRPTIESLNQQNFDEATATVFRSKNLYLLAIPSAAATDNDTVLAFDYVLGGWIPYDGINANAFANLYVNDTEERVYFGDYLGWVYRFGTGKNDYPEGVKTAIDAYASTNWRAVGELTTQKMTKNLYLYYLMQTGTLSVGWSYNLSNAIDDVLQTVDMSIQGAATYDSAMFDVNQYAESGYTRKIFDTRREGFCYRVTFSNANIDESFEIIAVATNDVPITQR